MGNTVNPNSVRQKLKRIAEELGICEHTVRWRYYHGYPLDKRYTPQKNPNPRKTQTAELRKAARARGEMKFEGAPCSKCGNPLRYVCNNKCVLCRS